MKKFFGFLFACVFFVLTACTTTTTAAKGTSAAGNTLTDRITVKKGNRIYRISEKQNITLSDYIFDICIDGITTEDNVCLFAYHNADYMDVYSFPVNVDDTEVFAMGNGVAEYDLDVEKGYTLSLNEPESFHYLFDARRINKENSCIIPVRDVTDSEGNFTDKIYFSIFVDYNKDRIMQKEEYATFIISFRK
ncbi:MAG: hypothetical protein J5857_06690 [Treponema sp.]|nr:hypothetical protein [Treponema sp.]